MGGEASKETELAGDEVEAAVDVSPVGNAENTPGETYGDRSERTDPGSTHKIEGDGHGEVRGNSNVSELEGVGCNIATAGVRNTSFDESRDTLTDDQLDALDSGQKQGESDITERSLLGAFRQSLPIASGIVLKANSASTDDKACRSSNSEAYEMENNSAEAKANGLTEFEGSSIDAKKAQNPTVAGEMNSDVVQGTSAGLISHDTSSDGGENQPKSSSVNKLEKTLSVGSEGMEEDAFFDADGDIVIAADTRDTVINTGENATPPAQTNNDIGLRSLDDLMGQDPVNITDSKEQGNLQIEQEEGQSGVVEANSQHTCLERVTSPQDSNIDGEQPVNNTTVNSSQVCSSLAEDPGVTPDQSDSDKKADMNGDNVSAKVESLSLNEVKRHLVCTQPSDETYDVNVAAGMQSHTLENTNADLKALPAQEKEQLPDFIATVSGQDESDVKGYSEAVITTDTSATLNLGQHSDQPVSSTKSREDDVTREDIVDTCIGNHVGVTCVIQNLHKPPPIKEISEEEKSVLSQQAEGDVGTKPSETVKGCDQNSISTKESDTSADTSATSMADNNDEINVNGESDDIPLPKGAYNLDFLDNLDDPNFNPFQSKSELSVDKTTCIEDKNPVESDKRSGCQMVTSDEPKQTDKSTESHVEPPVTNNSTENASVITAHENSDQGVQSNDDEVNGKGVGKGNSDVNGEIKNEAECDDNKNEVGTDVIRVDGSEHMDSPADESSTAEVPEDEPNKHNPVEENSVLETEENTNRCEPAVVTAMSRNNDSGLNESKENVERWVKSEQGTAAHEKDSSKSQIEKQIEDTDRSEMLDSTQNTDLHDTNKEDSVRKAEQETSKSTAQNTSEISGNSPTRSSENDTKSGGSHSCALGIDVEISKSDTSSSETVPNTNVSDQNNSSDIESSCDSIQQNVIEKSINISNDKTTDKQVDQEGNRCADSCDSDEVQKAEKSPQIKNENPDSLKNTDSEENKMDATVIGNNKSEVRIPLFNWLNVHTDFRLQ